MKRMMAVEEEIECEEGRRESVQEIDEDFCVCSGLKPGNDSEDDVC